jgi:hypothetical protein
MLRQKGLVLTPGAARPIPKEILHLVRLAHPDGWSVLLGLIVVTPELAGKWLKNNFRNRPVSDDTVNAYARDAVSGMFLTTHQGIAFNDKDELIDGQHRLLAIVKSGVACTLMVSFGWLSEIPGKQLKRMDLIDRGRTRSVPDQLKIQHGLKDGTAIAQISNCLANLCYGERTRRLSVGQTLDIYRAFEPAVLWVIERRSKQHGLKSAGVLGGFAFALMCEFTGDVKKPFWTKEKELTPIADLLECVNRGDDFKKLPPTSAIAKLRAFLVSDEAKLLTRGLDRGIAEMTLQAIYMERNGQWCEKLTATLEGADFYRQAQPDRVDRIAALFRLPEEAK